MQSGNILLVVDSGGGVPFKKIEGLPQQTVHGLREGRKEKGGRGNGDDGREERREGRRCERDGRCGGWLAREIMERWRAEKLGKAFRKVKEAR